MHRVTFPTTGLSRKERIVVVSGYEKKGIPYNRGEVWHPSELDFQATWKLQVIMLRDGDPGVVNSVPNPCCFHHFNG